MIYGQIKKAFSRINCLSSGQTYSHNPPTFSLIFSIYNLFLKISKRVSFFLFLKVRLEKRFKMIQKHQSLLCDK